MGIGKSAVANLASSAVIGVASGYLSQTGAATVLTVTPPQQLPARLRSPWLKRLALASAAGEMLANAHLTFLPKRTSPQALGGRIAFGAGSAALLAMSRGQSVVAPIVIGGVAAAVAAKIATDSRAVIARHLPDPLVGWAENAFAVGMAVAATRK